MGFRYRKSIKLGKGARVNFSKTGIGLSVGGKGFRYSVHSSGRKTATVGIPGSGISYSKTINSSSNRKKNPRTSSTGSLTPHQIKENQVITEQYNNYIHKLQHLHQFIVPPIEWTEIEQQPSPFAEGEKGPREIKAEEEFRKFKQNIFEKLIRSDGSSRKERLKNKISAAREDDLSELEEWKSNHELAQAIIGLDPEAYPYALEKYDVFQDLSDYCTDFDFSLPDPHEITVTFNVHTNEVIPTDEMTLTKTGKLSTKPLSKTKYFAYLQDYICSCSIKVARDLFSVLPVQTVITNVKDHFLNTTSGLDEERLILSVRFDRSKFNETNFERIDPSDFVESFPHNMKFGKTIGFKAINPLN